MLISAGNYIHNQKVCQWKSADQEVFFACVSFSVKSETQNRLRLIGKPLKMIFPSMLIVLFVLIRN
jgi:hypothetical protein